MDLQTVLNSILVKLANNYQNNTNDKIGKPSPIECTQLRSVAIYCLILFILSLLSNSILLIILIRHKEFRNATSIFMISLTILNLFGSLLEFPFVIFSNFYCRQVPMRNLHLVFTFT